MTPSFKLTWVTSAPATRAVGDGVAVVLARDLDGCRSRAAAPGGCRRGGRRRACRSRRRAPGEQLVAEADPEHRHRAEERPISRTRWPSAAGSPGPFDRKTPSGRRASTSAAGVVAGTTSTSTISAEVAQDRRLDPEVVGDDRVARPASDAGRRLGGRHLGDEVDAERSPARACAAASSSSRRRSRTRTASRPASRTWRVSRRVSTPVSPGRRGGRGSPRGSPPSASCSGRVGELAHDRRPGRRAAGSPRRRAMTP